MEIAQNAIEAARNALEIARNGAPEIGSSKCVQDFLAIRSQAEIYTVLPITTATQNHLENTQYIPPQIGGHDIAQDLPFRNSAKTCTDPPLVGPTSITTEAVANIAEAAPNAWRAAENVMTKVKDGNDVKDNVFTRSPAGTNTTPKIGSSSNVENRVGVGAPSRSYTALGLSGQSDAQDQTRGYITLSPVSVNHYSLQKALANQGYEIAQRMDRSRQVFLDTIARHNFAAASKTSSGISAEAEALTSSGYIGDNQGRVFCRSPQEGYYALEIKSSDEVKQRLPKQAAQSSAAPLCPQIQPPLDSAFNLVCPREPTITIAESSVNCETTL